MSRREIRAIVIASVLGAGLLAGALDFKGYLPTPDLAAFWRQHGDAVLFGGVLFLAFLTLLLVFARVTRKRLLRVRAQRDKARDALFILKTSADRPRDPGAPIFTTGAPAEALHTEFDEIMRRTFIVGGDR